MKIKTKQSAVEFNENMLPQTRTQVFFDVIKLHWRVFLILGLVLLIGFAPLLVCIFIRDNYALALSIKVNNGEISAGERLTLVKYAHLFCALGCWVSLYFLAIFICIIVRIISRLIWYEPIFIKDDIRLALSNGYKTAAICATFVGLILVVQKAMLFVTDNIFLQIVPVAIFVPFIAFPLLLCFMQSTIYQGSFSQLMKNAIVMYIKEALKVLLFGLLLLLPILLSILEKYLIVKYIAIVLYLFFFENLFIMMFQLCCNHIFDKFINKEQYPQIYRKGLWNEQKDNEQMEEKQ